MVHTRPSLGGLVVAATVALVLLGAPIQPLVAPVVVGTIMVFALRWLLRTRLFLRTQLYGMTVSAVLLFGPAARAWALCRLLAWWDAAELGPLQWWVVGFIVLAAGYLVARGYLARPVHVPQRPRVRRQASIVADPVAAEVAQPGAGDLHGSDDDLGLFDAEVHHAPRR